MKNKEYEKQGEIHPDFPESQKEWNKEEKSQLIG